MNDKCPLKYETLAEYIDRVICGERRPAQTQRLHSGIVYDKECEIIMSRIEILLMEKRIQEERDKATKQIVKANHDMEQKLREEDQKRETERTRYYIGLAVTFIASVGASIIGAILSK